MVLIEPGTASGFAHIKDARAQVSRKSEKPEAMERNK